MLRNRLGVRLLGTVPVSIALHLVAIMFLVIIPLVANVKVPLLDEPMPDFVRAEPVPSAPAAPSPARTAHAPIAERTAAAPTVAPPTIAPERPSLDTRLVEGAVSSADTGLFGTSVDTRLPAPPRAQEPPRHAGPIRAAELPVAPVRIADAQPAYPDVARAAHLDGTVVLECVIDTTGRVTNIRVLTSAPLFDQAAIEAVRRWRYTPSVYNGRPVSVLMTVTVRFVLK